MTESRGFKFVTTLVLVLKKIESDDKTKYDTFHSQSKAETIINESDIDGVFESIYSPIRSNIQKYLGKGSGWILDSVIGHNINISKYNILAGVSYIKLKDHPRRGLINILNIDGNECLHLSDHNRKRITKADKNSTKKLDFKDI